MSETVRKPWFTFISLLFVLASGVAWISVPKLGIWFTLLALLPWALRLLIAKVPLQRTPFDWFLVIFLMTAWVGYWAAYDKTTAWIKVWLIVTAVLLYYSLSAQPKENFNALSLLSFCIGLGVSFYFFLTHDFTDVPGNVAHWWMNNRPELGWHAIQHGYISGLLVITNIFATYWLWGIIKKPLDRYTVILKLFLIAALGIVFLAFILTMSRGIWAAAACGLGVWVLWKFTTSNDAQKAKTKSLFPVLVLGYLAVIIFFIYLGPAKSNDDSGQNDYGRNSRAEVFERGAYFLLDYPFTGAGLNSFPGTYSEYMLSIPYFYFANSYNMFLDVAIEQGLLGGFALAFIYLGSVWLTSRSILQVQSNEIRWISWLSLFALIVVIIHGLFYDYLYFGNVTMLLLFPVGISMIAVKELGSSEARSVHTYNVVLLLHKENYSKIIPSTLMVLIFLAINSNKVLSVWYADLGAVQMSRIELYGFPIQGWVPVAILPQLGNAEGSLRSALLFDSNNVTANYRLGLIFMLRRDFASAAMNLGTALQKMPGNRGVQKNLGYCYVWLGEMDQAQTLLESIPEASNELDVYVWWWGTQGRADLADKASEMLTILHGSASTQ